MAKMRKSQRPTRPKNGPRAYDGSSRRHGIILEVLIMHYSTLGGPWPSARAWRAARLLGLRAVC